MRVSLLILRRVAQPDRATDFENRDGNQPRQCNTHGALMENRDAGQRHAGQNEIDCNAEHRGILRHHCNGA